jgi:uncharacterized membrane protein HdeD (DUF308 family)
MTETSVSTGYKVELQLPPWWLVFLEGLVALIIGIYLITSPVATTIFLVWVLGIYWLIAGILTLVHLFTDRTDMIWKVISGIIGILAGLAVIEYPLLSAVFVPATFIILIGVLGIVYGAISLFYSLKLGWGAAIKGILSIIFGLLLIGSPYIGIVLLVYFLAVIGIVGGVATMYMGYKMRSVS